jgi:hypothetical protein
MVWDEGDEESHVCTAAKQTGRHVAGEVGSALCFDGWIDRWIDGSGFVCFTE